MKRKGITRGELAVKMNLTPSTMSLKLNGKSDISLKEALQIKNIICVDMPLEILFEYTGTAKAV